MAFRTNKTPVLQEKSASGAVASFNTALAMPLSSCNIAVNAWQEGSGTPSPDNVRTINGVSAINIMATGKNLVNININTSQYSGTYNFGKVLYGTFTLSAKKNDVVLSEAVWIVRIDYADGTYDYCGDEGYSNPFPCVINATSKGIKSITYRNYGITSGSYDLMFELGDIASPYEPYGTYTTIQIGSTVYGSEYDARTGVLTVTHGYREFDGSENWINVGGSYSQAFQIDTGITNAFQGSLTTQRANNITNLYPWASDEVVQYGIRWQLDVQSGRLYVYDNNYSSNLAGFTQHLSDTHLQVVYLLNNPITIQLPPCPIDTLEGVNNIWADTGDVDLTYKDLDIAKRGNFREVFRLPS